MLELVGVTKTYGQEVAVRDANLVVEDGEFVTLLGPSGSGKSTILSLIAGFTPLTKGLIRIDRRDVSRASAAERGIGIVFQNYALFPHMTIFENIAYGLKRRNWTGARITSRVTEMLRLIGLPELGHRRPHQLSGGQQQRVALARALAFSPSLLLMDEPLGALDREIRDQMLQEIRRIHRETRPSVVYVTHNREEAFALADRVAILVAGRVVAYDSARSLFSQPPNGFVASFFGSHEIFDVEVIDTNFVEGMARIRMFGTEGSVARSPRVTAPGPALLAVASRQVKLGAHPDLGIVIDVNVVDLIYMGDTTRAICAHSVSGARIQSESDSYNFSGIYAEEAIKLTICLQHAALVPRDS